MATSTITPTVTDQKVGLQEGHVAGTLAVGAGDYPANGIPMDLTGLVAGINGDDYAPADIQGLAGYVYRHDLTNGTLRIFETGAALSGPLAEVATTTPTAVTTDTIYFRTNQNRVGGTEG